MCLCQHWRFYRESLHCKAKIQNMSLQDVLACENPHFAVLTENEQLALRGYQRKFGMNRAYNLQQNPLKRPITSIVGPPPTMFTIIHNAGIIWVSGLTGLNGSSGRFLTPGETALLQGLDTRPACPARSAFPPTTPLSLDRTARTRTSFAGQVGNSMCTGVVGAVMWLASLGLGIRTVNEWNESLHWMNEWVSHSSFMNHSSWKQVDSCQPIPVNPMAQSTNMWILNMNIVIHYTLYY